MKERVPRGCDEFHRALRHRAFDEHAGTSEIGKP
jgi:hypothetical protein